MVGEFFLISCVDWNILGWSFSGFLYKGGVVLGL